MKELVSEEKLSKEDFESAISELLERIERQGSFLMDSSKSIEARKQRLQNEINFLEDEFEKNKRALAIDQMMLDFLTQKMKEASA